MRIQLREGNIDDIGTLMKLFCETVRTVNAADYTQEETEDWAACGENKARWEELMACLHFMVAEVVEVKGNRIVQTEKVGEKEIVGFASISDEGYLHSMFVHKNYQHCGVATVLLQAVEKYARDKGAGKIWSEVSVTARCFFEREGYKVMKEQKRKAKERELTNFVMEK